MPIFQYLYFNISVFFFTFIMSTRLNLYLFVLILSVHIAFCLTEFANLLTSGVQENWKICQRKFDKRLENVLFFQLYFILCECLRVSLDKSSSKNEKKNDNIVIDLLHQYLSIISKVCHSSRSELGMKKIYPFNLIFQPRNSRWTNTRARNDSSQSRSIFAFT